MKVVFNKSTKLFSIIGSTALLYIGGLALVSLCAMIFRKKKLISLSDYIDDLIDGYDSGRFLMYDVDKENVDSLKEFTPIFKVPKLSSTDKKTLAEINADHFEDYYWGSIKNPSVEVKFIMEFEKFVYGKDFYKQLDSLIKTGKKINEITLPTEDNKSTLTIQVYNCGKYGKLYKIHKDCGKFFEYDKRLPKVKDAIGFDNEVVRLIIEPAMNDFYLKYKNEF